MQRLYQWVGGKWAQRVMYVALRPWSWARREEQQQADQHNYGLLLLYFSNVLFQT